MPKLAIALLLAVAMAATPTLAVQSSTSISITMPSIVILYYRSSIDFDVSEPELLGLVGVASNPFDEGAPASSLDLGTDDAGVTGATFTEPNALSGTVNNFWAVRSVAPVGQTTEVSVALTTATLSHTDIAVTETIGLSNAEVRAGGAFASSVSFAPTGLGAADVQLGDVRFDVDLSQVVRSGSYTGGVVEITAVNM